MEKQKTQILTLKEIFEEIIENIRKQHESKLSENSEKSDANYSVQRNK